MMPPSQGGTIVTHSLLRASESPSLAPINVSAETEAENHRAL